MPMSDADKVALRTFLSTRRGEKVLQPDIQREMLTYLIAKNRPLRELPIHPPDDQVELESLVAEWADYAEAAGLDKPDARNVERWISRKDGGVMRSERGGKAVAVADALAAHGHTVDRDVERLIAGALVKSEQGEQRAQCCSVEVVWLVYLGQSPGEEDRKWFEDRRHGSSLSQGAKNVGRG